MRNWTSYLRRALPLPALLVMSVLAVGLFAVPASAQTPTCSSTGADADGDGWGWENNASCKVGTQTTSTDGAADAECVDPDGDGWGWDGSKSCRAGEEQTTPSSDNTSVTSLDAPQNLRLSTIVGQGQFVVAWDAVDGAAGYALYQNGDILTRTTQTAANVGVSNSPITVKAYSSDNTVWSSSSAPLQPQTELIVSNTSQDPNGNPYCTSSNDPDGDGWGWENGRSCAHGDCNPKSGNHGATKLLMSLDSLGRAVMHFTPDCDAVGFHVQAQSGDTYRDFGGFFTAQHQQTLFTWDFHFEATEVWVLSKFADGSTTRSQSIGVMTAPMSKEVIAAMVENADRPEIFHDFEDIDDETEDLDGAERGIVVSAGGVVLGVSGIVVPGGSLSVLGGTSLALGVLGLSDAIGGYSDALEEYGDAWDSLYDNIDALMVSEGLDPFPRYNAYGSGIYPEAQAWTDLYRTIPERLRNEFGAGYDVTEFEVAAFLVDILTNHQSTWGPPAIRANPNPSEPPCPGVGCSSGNSYDIDNDGISDFLDDDMDGDGIPNYIDRYPTYFSNSTDSDNDGTPDHQDHDIDGDGVPNYLDPDYANPATTTTTQPPTTTPDGGCEDSGNCPSTTPGHNVPNPGVCCDTTTQPITEPEVDPPGHNVPNPGVCCSKNVEALPTHDANGRAYCESASSDPDGDGWGWENNESCVVR